MGQEKKTKNQQNKVYINIIIAVLIKLCTSFLRAVAHDSQQKRHIHQKGGSSHCCTNNIHWATITTQKKKNKAREPGENVPHATLSLWLRLTDPQSDFKLQEPRTKTGSVKIPFQYLQEM